MEALQRLPLGLGQGACGMAAGVFERIEAQGCVSNRFNQGPGRLQITIRHPLVIDRTRPHLQLFEESRPFLPVGPDHCGSCGCSRGGLDKVLHGLTASGEKSTNLFPEKNQEKNQDTHQNVISRNLEINGCLLSTSSIYCMDALMPWAQGCAGAATLTAASGLSADDPFDHLSS
jgi:hypothetical protein